AASAARQLQDLRGATFSFGNRSSTSGHVMARYFLKRAGADADAFFSRVSYSDNHDDTLRLVAAGKTHPPTAPPPLPPHRPRARVEGRSRVLGESPAYVDYVWAVRRDTPGVLRLRLAEAFLDMNREQPEHAAALRAHGAGGFLPPSEDDYQLVAAALVEADAP